jgi:hypothetical protein
VRRVNRAGQRGFQDEPKLEEELGEIGMYLPGDPMLEGVFYFEDASRMGWHEREVEVAKNTVHGNTLEGPGTVKHGGESGCSSSLLNCTLYLLPHLSRLAPDRTLLLIGSMSFLEGRQAI